MSRERVATGGEDRRNSSNWPKCVSHEVSNKTKAQEKICCFYFFFFLNITVALGAKFPKGLSFLQFLLRRAVKLFWKHEFYTASGSDILPSLASFCVCLPYCSKHFESQEFSLKELEVSKCNSTFAKSKPFTYKSQHWKQSPRVRCTIFWLLAYWVLPSFFPLFLMSTGQLCDLQPGFVKDSIGSSLGFLCRLCHSVQPCRGQESVSAVK